MRKALFAIVLVAASFAGGAAVNGPGLKWAQAMVMSRLGLDDDNADRSGDIPVLASGTDETAARPIPPLVAEPSEISRPDSSETKPPESKGAQARAKKPARPAPAEPQTRGSSS